MPTSLDHVRFGHIAAEEEANELKSYFLETPEYQELLTTPSKMIVIGRKGSGKSAIYVNLRDTHTQQKDVEVIALQLDDHPWEVHKKVCDETGARHRAYVTSWSYLMLVELIKSALRYETPSRHKWLDTNFWRLRFNPNLRRLNRFMVQNYGRIAPNFAELLIDRARNIRKITLAGTGAETQENDDYRKLSKSISGVRKYLQETVLAVLSPHRTYFILFDQLDRGWDSSEESRTMLIGLILASRDLLRQAALAQKKLRIIIFLRDDIFTELSFEDKNKLTPDMVKLVWNNERLKNLIEKRIETSAGAKWEEIITDQEMRNRQNPFAYMLKHTLHRPRDIINFCRNSLDRAIVQGHDRIQREDITFAETQHSSFMRNEYLDENRATHPYLSTLLEIIRELGSWRVIPDKFLDAYEAKKAIDISLVLSGNDALQLLIELSVLGVRRPQPGGGRPWTYRYLEEPTVRLEPKGQLEVHPCLVKVLNLSEKTPEVD